MSLMAAMGRALAGAVVLGLPLVAAAGEPETTEPAVQERVGEDDVHFFIGERAYFGKPIFPANEVAFKIKLTDTGTMAEIKWAALSDFERKRVQKIFRLNVDEAGGVVFGEKLKGVRLHLESGKEIEGLPIPERNRPGMRALRTKTMQLLMVYEREIKREEEIEVMESDVYGLRDIYDRIVLAKPPGEDPAAHLKYAEQASNMGLFKEAIEHLRIAETLDSRTAERNKEFVEELIKKHMESEGDKLFGQLMSHYRGDDFFAAADVLARLDKNFPQHPMRSRWESMRSRIEEGTKTDLNRKVVQLSYRIADDLIRQRLAKKTRIDAEGNVVPSLPGKQISTTHGHVFRGQLISTEANGDRILKGFDQRSGQLGDTTITIRAKDVMTEQDVDMSIGVREVPPSFDELKRFITDSGSPAGLKGQMLARIAQMLNEKEAEVRKVFDARLQQTAVYEDGRYTINNTFAIEYQSSYGRGSWLRDGARFLPSPAGLLSSNNTNSGQNAPAALDPDKYPDLTDDPNIWWKFQSAEQQFAILKAMAGEKVFKVMTEIISKPCGECGSRGTIFVPGSGGRLLEIRCPACRGLKAAYLVRYH